MLVLSRKVGEKIFVGDQIVITTVRANGGAVRIGIEAPEEMLIIRSELAKSGSGGIESVQNVDVQDMAGVSQSNDSTGA